jgi:HD-GYP domain-containing protein (c-di-GMP phosphodiesterase class II)
MSVITQISDPYTYGHERRVGAIAAAVAIAEELGFDPYRIEGIRIAGFMHDIGKISVPAEILAKPGKLTYVEFQLVKRHSQDGYQILKGINFPWPVAEVALQHHERLDGSGYPRGLKADAILMEARIMSVADVLEATASHRPYRPALGIDRALSEVEQGRGILYDPVVVDACLKLFREKGYQLPE